MEAQTINPLTMHRRMVDPPRVRHMAQTPMAPLNSRIPTNPNNLNTRPNRIPTNLSNPTMVLLLRTNMVLRSPTMVLPLKTNMVPHSLTMAPLNRNMEHPNLITELRRRITPNNSNNMATLPFLFSLLNLETFMECNQSLNESSLGKYFS